MFPVADHTIFLTLAGSQAHGTARVESDVDLRGVCVAPAEVRHSLFRSFEQHEALLDESLAALARSRLERHPTASRCMAFKAEVVVFDVAKFLRLCAAANPSALEILFADQRDWLYESPTWVRIHEARTEFLSQKIQQTFLGYALAQLRKIKTHRSWLLHPPKAKPSRADYGLPDHGTLNRDDRHRMEQGIAERLRSYGIDDIEMPKPARIAVRDRVENLWRDALGATEETLEEELRVTAMRALTLPADIVETLRAEKKYRAAMKQWEAYQAWKAHRNPARAALERRFGYDTKHAMHMVRLMRMGVEALRDGEIRVRRPDAGELSAIRDGAWSYERLVEHAAEMQVEMKSAAEASRLPVEVDLDRIDQLALSVILAG